MTAQIQPATDVILSRDPAAEIAAEYDYKFFEPRYTFPKGRHAAYTSGVIFEDGEWRLLGHGSRRRRGYVGCEIVEVIADDSDIVSRFVIIRDPGEHYNGCWHPTRYTLVEHIGNGAPEIVHGSCSPGTDWRAGIREMNQYVRRVQLARIEAIRGGKYTSPRQRWDSLREKVLESRRQKEQAQLREDEERKHLKNAFVSAKKLPLTMDLVTRVARIQPRAAVLGETFLAADVGAWVCAQLIALQT